MELPSRKSDLLAGKRVAVQALGCRTNIAEAEAIASLFEKRGARVINDGPCDVAVIVTCSVTAVADRKSRQLVYRWRRENPDACLVVCGCWAQGAREEDVARMGASLLVGNRHKSEIPDLVCSWFEGHKPGLSVRRSRLGAGWDGLELERSPYYGRAFIKVQDGCNHRCTYCIVPALRGPSVSRPMSDILDEARRCIAVGQFELIVTGVHLGLYGKDSGTSLAELVRELGKLDGICRLRFGSLEPFCIGDDLLDALASSKVFCRHLHLPLQSGDDEILRRMGRGHTAEEYLYLTERLRGALGDDLHISTDVMCAFPGETDEAFAHTLELLSAARIGRVHGFHYSPRPGTPAAGFPAQVPTPVAQDRVERLKEFGKRSLESEAERWVGRTVEVLFEGLLRGHSQGYSRGYLEFRPRDESIYNELRRMTVTSSSRGILYGKTAQ